MLHNSTFKTFTYLIPTCHRSYSLLGLNELLGSLQSYKLLSIVKEFINPTQNDQFIPGFIIHYIYTSSFNEWMSSALGITKRMALTET